MKRGEVYEYPRFDRRLLIVSTQPLTDEGSAIVVEVGDEAPKGTQGMLAVELGGQPPMSAFCWRVNYMRTDRLGARVGIVPPQVMEHVDMALRTAMDL